MAYQKRQYVRKVFTLFSNGSVHRFDPNLQVSDPWDFDKVVSLMEVHLEYVKTMNSPDVFILDEYGVEVPASA
jgi:hypothetical protein